MAKLTLALEAGENPLAPADNEPWVTPDELATCDTSDDIDLVSVCYVASEILYILSGRKYGVRTETIRPYAGSRSCGWGMFPGTEWQWRWWSTEGAPDWVVLKGPVQQILAVKLDGNTLVQGTDYFLYDNRRLVRGPDVHGLPLTWPIYQRLDVDDSNEGTFSVHYQWGQAVPEAGKMAAQVFACQLAKYLDDDPASQLRDRVVNITRQGVNQIILDPSQFFSTGRTGLYVPDIWLAAVNPMGRRRQPRVYSPDSIQNMRPT